MISSYHWCIRHDGRHDNGNVKISVFSVLEQLSDKQRQQRFPAPVTTLTVPRPFFLRQFAMHCCCQASGSTPFVSFQTSGTIPDCGDNSGCAVMHAMASAPRKPSIRAVEVDGDEVLLRLPKRVSGSMGDLGVRSIRAIRLRSAKVRRFVGVGAGADLPILGMRRLGFIKAGTNGKFDIWGDSDSLPSFHFRSGCKSLLSADLAKYANEPLHAS